MLRARDTMIHRPTMLRVRDTMVHRPTMLRARDTTTTTRSTKSPGDFRALYVAFMLRGVFGSACRRMRVLAGLGGARRVVSTAPRPDVGIAGAATGLILASPHGTVAREFSMRHRRPRSSDPHQPRRRRWRDQLLSRPFPAAAQPPIGTMSGACGHGLFQCQTENGPIGS
jgi:hypothetical protein